MSQPSTPETYVYHTPVELQGLSETTLQQLLDTAPTEVRDFCARRYLKLVKQQRITSDDEELALIERLLDKYTREGLIPAGSVWLKLGHKQRDSLGNITPEVLTEVDQQQPTGFPKALLLLGSLIGLSLFALLLSSLLSRQSQANLPVATVTETLTPSLTPTITLTPTLTPIALVESDLYINQGERSDQRFFPVLLQVQPPADSQPRVFVVQERRIETTEWAFEGNPDVVSWLAGTLIRPVLGVPFTPDNQQWLQMLPAGTQFHLRMNTGAELRFSYEGSQVVSREALAQLQQTEPGVVLVLIGEVGADGLPTAERLVVTGRYLATQELDSLAALVEQPLVVGQTARVGALEITVLNQRLLPAKAGLAYLVLEIQMYASEAIADLSGYDWFLQTSAARYAPDGAFDPGDLGLAPLPASLSAGETRTSGLRFLIPGDAGDSLLMISPITGTPIRFAVPVPTPVAPATTAGLVIDVMAIQRDSQQVYTDLRLYNPQAAPVIVTEADIGVMFGFTPQPIGPRIAPVGFITQEIPAGSAVEVTLRFPWNGKDPYAQLTVAQREYAITVVAVE